MVPSRLEATEQLPFEVCEVTFEPRNHPSLRAFLLTVGFVHSLTEVVVLSAVVQLVPKGWTERSGDTKELQWRYQNYLWNEIVGDPAKLWREALARAEASVRAYLETLIPRTEEVTSEPADLVQR